MKKNIQTFSQTGFQKHDFFERVYELVRLIPFGRVTTYGHIARALGSAGSSRMVGWALNCVQDRIAIPCHRVVNRNGELSGKMHFSHPDEMRLLLLAEHITFIDQAVDLEQHLWIPPDENELLSL
jgi:methylated-DNA-protein-cysteine methyltransferase-like protein